MQDQGMLLGERSGVLLRRLLVTIFLTSIAGTLYGWSAFGWQWTNIGGLALASVALVAYGFLSYGEVRKGIATLIWGTLAVILTLPFIVAGVRTPALAAIPALCIIAGWLVSIRAATAIFVSSSVVIIGLTIAEQWGYAPPNVPRTSVNFAMVLVPSFLLALLVTAGAIQSFQNQLDELRLSEERFSALFRANPMPSSTNDGDGRIIDVNDAWVRLYNVPRAQAIGKTAQEAGVWTDPEDRRRIYAELGVSGTVDGSPLLLQDGQGVKRPFLLYIEPVEFGGRQRFVTTMVDQTDRHSAEQAQRLVQEELELRVAQRTEELSRTVAELTNAHNELVQSEKLVSLGAMVAGISHELNTPIGNTVTVASTLQDRVREFKKHLDSGNLRRSELGEFLEITGEMSDMLVRSTGRASELVASFKQVAVDRSSERRRNFVLTDLVQELLVSLKPGMRKSAINITVDIAPGMACDGYPGPVGQVLTNLIQNAMTHAFGESATGTIAIHAHSDGKFVTVEVGDNGKGMDEHTLKHAFDPFFTTRLGQGGSGLGLSVSHRIATTVLGGSLTASTGTGGGSVFVFRFLQHLPKEV